MFKGKKQTIRIAALLYIVALTFFIWGIAAGHHKIFPFKQLLPVYNDLYGYLTFKDGPHKPVKERIILDHQERHSKYDFSGFRLRDPGFHDTGYLLISRYSKKHRQVIVELFSIAESRVLHTWLPPVTEILKRTPHFKGGSNSRGSYRAQHPLLLKDGGLVFTSGEGPMVRINGCGDVVWIINRHFHHSIELDHQGNIVVPIVVKGENTKRLLPIRDDGFAIVSLDGQILKEYSITNILLKNGYRGLIYGVGEFEKDRIHLNDAQPIVKDLGGANIGDISLSSRSLSTVALFQPQSGKIAWLKTGPWLNQHDINQLDDGRYSIFGNDVIRLKKTRAVFIKKGKSDVYVFDPEKNNITRPYSDMMAKERIATGTGGRSKILANGDVYIVESDYWRLIRASPEKVRWEYVNSLSPDTVGAIHWPRYISSHEIDLSWQENLICK
jgi:hypothetical protein